jgi:uncharacterized protein
MHRRSWNLVLGASLGFGNWDLGFLRRRASFVALFLFAVLVHRASAVEVLPPKPPGYFNDYAGVVPKQKALELNEKLAQFERETSNQVVVAVYQKMETDSSVEDFAQRIAQSWGVGQKSQSGGNGVVVLVFIADHKISIQVGYGLEGALPDVTAFDIRSRHMNPRFRNGDYAGGLAEGIDLICKAIRGEYKGAGETVQERRSPGASSGCGPLGFVIMLIIVLTIIRLGRRRGGFGYTGLGGPFISSGWGSGWSGSSSSSGGGFSGFSGGGGGFGGGGSSGSW